MGLLEHADGRILTLSARTLVGRAPLCHARLEDGAVSAEHAVMWWEDGAWWLRDLGSRNGTRHDGTPLANERVALTLDATVRFGHRRQTWRLVDAGPPVAVAVAEDKRVHEALGVLALPDEADPAVLVHRVADTWWLDADDGRRPVADQEVLDVRGRPFRLFLPTAASSVEVTHDAVQTERETSTVSLVLWVSADQEHIDLDVHVGSATHRLPHRAYHDLVRALAVVRLADRDQGVSDREQGWVHADALVRELRVTEKTLTLHVFRVRQAMAEVGVPDAKGVIERRSTGHLRLGVAGLRVEGPEIA